MDSPKIRFKGYTDAWEQRKLGDVAKFSKGNGYSKSDLVENGTPIVLYGRLYTNYETTIKKVDTFVVEKENSVFSKGGEVIIPASGETAKDIARASAVENSGILLGGDLNIIEPEECVNSSFLALSISNGDAQKELSKKAQGKSVVHVRNDEIKRLAISFPNRVEQDKIEGYFTNLDNLITLHQRKCEQTKKLKKFMLQKMFPKDGANVPEIRFSGFTDAWEQRKLGDVAKFSKGNGYSKSDLVENGTPIVLYGRLYTNYETTIKKVDTFVVEKENSVFSKGGEVIIPASGETAKDIARASAVENSGILLGGDLNIIEPEECVNSSFLALSISNGDAQKELSKKAQGKSVVHVRNDEIKRLAISFPNRVEQDKIEGYFTNLDNLITLHQRKYEELQKIKKFMLQNLFV